MPQDLYSLHQHTTTTYRRDLRPTTSRVVLQLPYNTMETKEGHARQLRLGEVLRQQNLRQCEADRCFWTIHELGALIYVDDLLLVGEATKIATVHLYFEGYFHVEACDYTFQRASGKETTTS